jgi:hypothetical protein
MKITTFWGKRENFNKAADEGTQRKESEDGRQSRAEVPFYMLGGGRGREMRKRDRERGTEEGGQQTEGERERGKNWEGRRERQRVGER